MKHEKIYSIAVIALGALVASVGAEKLIKYNPNDSMPPAVAELRNIRSQLEDVEGIKWSNEQLEKGRDDYVLALRDREYRLVKSKGDDVRRYGWTEIKGTAARTGMIAAGVLGIGVGAFVLANGKRKNQLLEDYDE